MKRGAHHARLLAGLLVFMAWAAPGRAEPADNSAFLDACWKGARASVETFLVQGVDVNAPGKDGYTALHYAVLGGHREIASLLLERGADVEVRYQGGNAALHFAVEKGHREITELLLDHGAKIDAPGDRGRAPLHVAVELYQDPAVEFTELLLVRDANTNARNDDDRTPLHFAISHRRGQTDVLELLLAGGTQVEARDNEGRTPLFGAAAYGDVTKVALLLARGADPRARDNNGNTPLHMAARPDGSEAVPGMADVIVALLEAKAEINARNSAGKIPLHDAEQYLTKETVALLIARGADTTPRWPLRDAAQAGDRAKVAALLAAGADINGQDDQERTALHEAVIAGHTDVVRLLLFRLANVSIRDGYQCTPLFYAAEAGDRVMVNLLFARGAEVNVRANDSRAGNTPLHEAARAKKDAAAMVTLLLAKGAVINARNNYGETPLDYAMFRNNRDAAELLLARSVDRSLSGDAEAAILEGIAAAQEGRFPEAIRHFEAARRFSPNSPLPRYYLGQAEAGIPGRELRAICWFKSYLAAVPRAPERRAITAEIATLQARSTALLIDLLTALTTAADALPAPSAHEAEDPDGPHQDHALMTVAVLWARVGDEKKALERASLVLNAQVRSQAEIKIAEAVAGTGDLKRGRGIVAQAVATAASSPRHDRRERALSLAAVTLANLGDGAGAQSIAAPIEDAGMRSEALAAIARAQADAGDPEGAVLITRSIPVLFLRATTEAALARMAAESGDHATAARALGQARATLAEVTRSGANVYSPPSNYVVARATPLDHLGRSVYPPPAAPRSAAQVNAQAFNVSEIYRDCFIADGLLGDFNRDDAWRYRVAWHLTPLKELARARARLGDQGGAAAIFDYLGGRGPWSEEVTKEWGPDAHVMLAEILALQGDEVGAKYRLKLARTSAEKIGDDEWRARALQSIATAANGWIAANEGFLNDSLFLNLPAYLRALPQEYVTSAFAALADTTLALADAQRAVATMRPRPILP